MIDVSEAPELQSSEVIDKMRSEIGMEEFLFYRTGFQEFDIFLTGHETPVWEMECTACGERFYEPKDRKNPPKNWKRCPICGAPVEPRQWNHRAVLDKQRLSYYVFQPDGERMWARGYKMERKRDASFEAFEYCRIVYYPGGARRWVRSRDYFHGVHEWEPVKSVCLKRWHRSYGITEDNWYGGIAQEDIRGTCIAYSQLDRAIATLDDPIEYLALYCRYPACEYLWKMGFGHWFRERENGSGMEFKRVVNLRAKKPDRLLPRFSRQEIKLMRKFTGYSVRSAAMYLRLREAGAVQADMTDFAFADAVCRGYRDFFALAERSGAAPGTLRKYYNKQSGRSNRTICQVMDEHWDYLNQLDRLMVGGERMPHDLHEAHARLSERERMIKNRGLNGMFRARRRLLRWMCWKHAGMFIRPVDSAEEITREGEEQKNCVAGYAKRHAEGKTIILLLRKCSEPRSSWHTVEIDPVSLRCRQCYGHGNRQRTADAAEFMEQYLAHLQQVRPVRNKRKRERSAA